MAVPLTWASSSGRIPGVRNHLGTRATGKDSWSFQCWVPHSMVASILAANFWAWSPNADKHFYGLMIQGEGAAYG